MAQRNAETRKGAAHGALRNAEAGTIRRLAAAGNRRSMGRTR
jgi:hypothetical protein